MEEKLTDPIYSETAYDDAFRSMEGRCDDILIPFVGHMFGIRYGEGAKIKRLRNEQFIEKKDEADEKRITDSSFEITDKSGNLSALSTSAIIKLTYSVAYKLTMNQKKVQRKVGDYMGGKVLDLPEFRIYDQGKEDGIIVGRAEGEQERKALQQENERLKKELEKLKANMTN